MKKLLLIFCIVYLNGMGFHKFNDINILNLIMQLNLSQPQKKEIQVIIKNCRKLPMNRPNFLKNSFINNHFDKQKYITLKTNFIKTRIEKQAQMIDKIINVLTKKQKQKLGEILDRNFND